MPKDRFGHTCPEADRYRAERRIGFFGLALLLAACSSGKSSTAGGAGQPSVSGAGGSGAAGATGSGGSTAGSATSGAGGSGASGGSGGSAGGAGSAAGGVAGTSAATGGATTGGSSGAGAGGTGGSAGHGGSVSGTGGGAGSLGQAGETGAVGTMPTEMALAKLPTIRQEHSVVALKGEIYVIGGYTPGKGGGGLTPTDSVIAYDPQKNSWRDAKSFPGQINHGNAGVIGDKIYVGGFYTANGMTAGTTQSFSYDPASDAWTEISPLPQGTERGAGCVAVLDDRMYVVGGQNNGKSVAFAARYDPTQDQWDALPDLPERKEHCVAAAMNGLVYVVGGRIDGITTFQPKSYAFDPQAMKWLDKTPIITPRGGLAGGILGGKLYVAGGEGNPAANSNGVFPDIDQYDPDTDTWKKVGEMLIPRHGFGGAVLDGKLYLPGGATQQGGGASDNDSVFWLE